MEKLKNEQSIQKQSAVEEKQEKILALRSYQKKLVQKCYEENTIVYLPTGAGKTLIAIEVLKLKGESLALSLSEGGKRSVYLAPTRALVYQTADVIRNNTSYKVGEYTGDLGIDFWPREKWRREFEKLEVFVMPPAVLQNCLKSGFATMDMFNLLIIDECHNGVSDSPMRAVMREMQYVEKEKQPRVIGMSATLLNRTVKASNVKSEVEALECTFHAVVATCDEVAEVLEYSSDPDIRVHAYIDDSKTNIPLKQLQMKLQTFMDDLKAMLSSLVCWDIQTLRNQTPALNNFSVMGIRSYYKSIIKMLDDYEIHANSLGVYGGSLSALFYIIKLEQEILLKETEVGVTVLHQTLSYFRLFRSLSMQVMQFDESADNIYKVSTAKVRKFIDLLKIIAAIDNSALIIVFVERRVTAVVLYHILKKLCATEGFGLESLVPGFAIGHQSNPFVNTREGSIEMKYLRNILKRFAKREVNTLIATSVVEEGVNVPSCNFVIHFDAEKLHYCNFFQGKGRARSKESSFFAIVEKGKKEADLLIKLQQFALVESELKKLLIGWSNSRTAPEMSSIQEQVYEESVRPYHSGKAHVSGVTAISCVFNYCRMLPQDIFSNLTPTCWLKVEHQQCQVVVQLPIVSPVKKLILGDWMANRKLAKRSAFLNVVKVLHEEGELDDNLKPIVINSATVEYDWLFPHYIKGESENAGTSKNRRIYPINLPSLMKGCRNPCQSYLHIIHFIPFQVDNVEDTRILGVHEALDSDLTYGILTANPSRTICDFSLHLSSGEINCTFIPNVAVLDLSEESINLISNFHFQLFSSVIPVARDFHIFNQNADFNSYYVIPVKFFNKTIEVDWATMRNINSHVSKVTVDRSSIIVNDETHKSAIVSPYYRFEDQQRLYLVTKVRYDLSPKSKFPDSNITTFESYYREKWGEKILSLSQPLLDVKIMPSLHSNFIRPRTKVSEHSIKSRRKRIQTETDFKEVLIPELCNRFTFPSPLWLKGMLLPTALHRISSLLLVEELRLKIHQDTSLGLSQVRIWEKLVPNITPEESSSHSSPMKENVTLIDNKSALANTLMQQKEPIPLYCNMNSIAECDLQYYVDYARRTVPSKSDDRRPFCPEAQEPYRGPIVPIQLLNLPIEVTKVGPQLRNLLAAVTGKSANDIVNLERLETLGDSFLKFASTLFLFREFPKMNEGALVVMKGKLVSNRNLLYCAQKKNIPDLLLMHEFSASGDWVPPMFEVPRELTNIMVGLRKDPRLLYNLDISKEERRNGKIKTGSLIEAREMILKGDSLEDAIHYCSAITYLNEKSLSDKSVADCVEALIGAYIQSCGINGGFKILNWFDLLPKEKGSMQLLIGTPAMSPLLVHAGIERQRDVLAKLEKVHAHKLEKIIGYTFKDKSFLLQALTHPTCASHNFVECYQRLEFLGDAVLDFLITSYIFEQAPHLDPGKITALRSALVNNGTFACLVVKYGLYKFLLYACPPLSDTITNFVAFQMERNHLVDEAVELLLEEKDCSLAESVDVPKVLGDLFESLAGAIFLDSGNSLETVWEVYSRLMKTELDAFPQKIPRNPISILFEVAGKDLKIVSSVMANGVVKTRIDVKCPTDEIKSLYGFGKNKFEAKKSAAKIALKYLMSSDTNC